MHVRRCTVALLAATVLAGSAAAPTASAAVTPPRTVSGAGLSVQHFALAMNPSGERSAVAYEGLVRGSRGRRTQLFARVGRSRSLGPRQELDELRSGPGVRAQGAISDVRIAVAPDGAVVVAWVVTTVERRNGPVQRSVRYAGAPANGRFGRAQTALQPPRNSTVGLAGLVTGRGGLAVVLLERGNRVEVLVRRGARARFAKPQRIGGGTAFEAPPSLALSPGGVVVAAWTEQRDTTAHAAVLRRSGRRFGTARMVSPAREPTAFGRAVAGPGGAGVAWKLSASPSRLTRFARLRSATGTFAPAVTVADDNLSGAPHVALPRLGIGTAWRQYEVVTEPGDNDFLRNSRLFATASWLAGAGRKSLSQLPALALRPALAALSDRALIAWEEAPAYEDSPRVRLAVAGPDGWEPTATLAPVGPVSPRTRPETSILGDERPGGADLAIAAGHRDALLAFLTFTQTEGDDGLVGALHVAGYRP